MRDDHVRDSRSSGRLLFVSVLLLIVVEVHAQPSYVKNQVDLMWGVKIPMRDGVKLNATVYKPHDMPARLPVIFTLTPYVADGYHDRAMYFARQGYVFALIDVRGRGNSQGVYEPYSYINTGRDGYDTVEWLARQPWCDGKVAMWGGSYAGYDQWTTLAQLPPHLVTIVPAGTAHPTLDLFDQNIFNNSLSMGFLTHTSGVTQNLRIQGDGSFWNPKLFELYSGREPLRNYDRISGNPSRIFQKWMNHLKPDEYWDAMLPTPKQYQRMNIPILHITGYFDSLGAIWFYNQHMKYGSSEGKAKHYLIVGPWTHAGTRTPEAECCGQKFGPASVLDLNQLHKEWYDWTMKGGPKPDFIKDRVAYYEPGPEEWRYAESLGAIPSTGETLYLQSPNGTDGLGILSGARPSQSTTDAYTYDPLDLRRIDAGGLSNYEMVSKFGNGLIYSSDPFKETVQVTGFMKFVAWISIDVPDTDFYVTVYEVEPDGNYIRLGGNQMRARNRESLRRDVLVVPGAILKYEFNGFHIVSKRIGKGSRLTLVITSTPSLGSQKNYNSGGVVADETARNARTARIKLYHDSQYPSFLSIPVVTR